MSDRPPLRLGICGAGRMGRSHQQAIAAWGARVVAVHDARREAAESLANDCGADLATDELERLFSVPLDGLVIATPPPVRLEPIRLACERGVHLMVEKPPALTLAEGRLCQEAIAASGVIAAVGFQLRYHPLFERLRELLAGRTVHLVRTVCTIDYYLTFRVPPWFLQQAVSGGPLAEQAIHPLDCVRWVLGDPAPVAAHALATKSMAADRPELDAENAVQMSYELAGGIFGTHLNHCGHERFCFDHEVLGPHLRLQANLPGNHLTGYLDGTEIDEPAAAGNSLGLDKTGAWLQAIATGDRSLVRASYEGSLQTLALVEAAVRSRGTGAFVAC